MVRRLILLVLAFAVCFTVADARRRTPKAGEAKDGVYADAEYNFQLQLPDGWSYTIKDNDDPVRLVLMQKNYQIPPDYLDAEDYTQIPRLTVYLAETPLSAIAFRDSLISKSYSSDLKGEIRKHFEILNDFAVGDGTQREEVVTRNKSTMYIDSLPAVSWTGKSQYIKSITLSASSQSGRRVYGDYTGTIVAVKNGEQMLLFHLMTEGMYHDPVWQEIEPAIKSLKWAKK